MAQQAPVKDDTPRDFVKTCGFYGGSEGDFGAALADLVEACGGDLDSAVPEYVSAFKQALEAYTGRPLD